MGDDVVFVVRLLEEAMAIGVGALITGKYPLLSGTAVEGMHSLYPLADLHSVGTDILYRCCADLSRD